MPRLSEPMREALRMAVAGHGLARSKDGWWRSALNHVAISLLSVVASLYEARSEIERLKKEPRA